jgi:riboflavin kinase/FMN adenylyltransferase
MKTIESISELGDLPKGAVLTIGNFDGVHIGHQEIISAAKRIAAQKQTELVIMTFQPHPLSILNPEKAPSPLTPPVLKEHLLAELGVGILFTAKSEPELLNLSAEDFVKKFIVKWIRPSVIVEGEDFNFGHKRAGSVYTLRKLAGAEGIDVVIVEPQKAKLADGRVIEVSSTVIRDMITKGELRDAAILLGRPYRLIGNIAPGRGKGKELGFPTLNLAKPGQLVPAEGVYAGLVEIGDSEAQVCSTKEKIPAALSIGRTLTFGANQPLLIEAHLLVKNIEQFSGRLMAMDFVTYIRPQRKFESQQALAAQIADDCAAARNILTVQTIENSEMR